MSTPAHDQPEFKHSSVEAEQALIGKIMTDEIAAAEALAICAPEDFCHNPHARIVEVCIALRDDGMKVTPLTVRARLGSELAEIGGFDYLVSISRIAPILQSTQD